MSLVGNPWGALMNPAGLAGVAGRMIAVSAAPAPFGLNELRRSACAYAEPLGCFTLSAVALRYGFELYREVTVGAACGVDCGKGVRAGATVTLNTLSIAGYGRGACTGVDAGVIWEIVRGLDLGAVVSNLNAPSPGRLAEGVPRTIQAGIAYTPVGGFLVSCDISEDARFPAEVRLGAEFLPAGFLALRGGISTDPSTCSAGIGIRISPVEIEYAFTRHQELGFTHRFGLSLRLGGT